MARRKGQFAISTIIGLIAIGGIAIGGTFFISELIALLKLVTNNIFYTGILAVAIIIALSYYRYIQNNTDLSPAVAGGGALLVMGLAIGAPFLTGEIAEMQRSYTATFSAEAAGGRVSQVSFQGIELENLEQGGPRFFSAVRQGSILPTTDYDVEITVVCEGEEIGTTTISGEAPSSNEGQISRLPPQSSCTATGVMTAPAEHKGLREDTVRFNTP